MFYLEQHNNIVCNDIRASGRSWLIFVPVYTAVFFVMYFGITYGAVVWSLWKANEEAHTAEAKRRKADQVLCVPQKMLAVENQPKKKKAPLQSAACPMEDSLMRRSRTLPDSLMRR
jgi:hypothetical protein